MKFTKEEAFEKLKGILTNNGKKALRMSERSINKQLESLTPLIANEDMELDDFIDKVKDTFSVINSNVEKDNSDFVKQWEKDHPSPQPPTPASDKPGADDKTAEMLKRLEELEKKEAERAKETALSQKRKDLLKAMKDKGIKDEQWARSVIAKFPVTEDTDVESEADDFLKIYNKGLSDQPRSITPFGGSPRGDRNEDPLSDVRKMIENEAKELESLTKK